MVLPFSLAVVVDVSTTSKTRKIFHNELKIMETKEKSKKTCMTIILPDVVVSPVGVVVVVVWTAVRIRKSHYNEYKMVTNSIS